MKKIGIIDYFIDEWHSNKYLGLFEQANKELGLDYKVAYGWAEDLYKKIIGNDFRFVFFE